MSSNPTTIQSANSNVSYGLLHGHSSETADAIREYIQAQLKSEFKTWVRIPPELWPDSWRSKGLKAPMCLLVKALYGHPESGGHWERHLTDAVKAAGGKPVDGHPSSFFFAEKGMLLTVYVDDLLLSGPTGNHKLIWQKLKDYPIEIDPSEPLSRFLGRTHVTTELAV